MDGPILIAFAHPVFGSMCFMWHGYQWGVRDVPDNLPSMVSSQTTSDGGARVVCRLPVAFLGISASKGGQRVILATGDLRGIGPAQHADEDKTMGRVDFYAGTVNIGVQIRARVIGGVIYFLVLIAWCSIGFALFYRQALVSVLQRQLFTAGTVAMYFVLQAIFFGVWYADVVAGGQSAPASRAFGGITSISLMWILYPVPKHFGPAVLIGSTYAQAVSYHMLFAIMALVIMTMHYSAMSIAYMDNNSDAVSVSSRYAHKPLYGFLAWLLMLFTIGFALFARRRMYAVFRVVHMVWLAIVVFAALHNVTVLITLCIPLAMYAVDLVLRVVSWHRISGKVVAATGHIGAGVIAVQVQLGPASPAPTPTQFGLFTFGATLVPHPFSIAWYDPKTRIAEVFVKANGAGTFTRQILENALANKLVGVSATATGFHGELQVPLSRVERVLLVAGGIGITPLLSILCAAALQDAAPQCAEFRLIWVARTADVVKVMETHLAQARSVLQKRLVLQIYVTQPAQQASSGATHTELGPEIFHEGRPATADLVANSFEDFCGPVGVYTCGPEALMDEVSAGVARRRMATFLHSETFTL
jgi:predicted ferric reductase